MSMTRGGTAGAVFWSRPAFAASMATLLGELLVAGAAVTISGLGGSVGPSNSAFLMVFVLPVVILLGAVPGFVVTTTLVLPSLWLARWAVGRGRLPGRPAWWWPVIATPFSAACATVVYSAIFAFLYGTVAPLRYLAWWPALTVIGVPAVLFAAYAARDSAARRSTRLPFTVKGGGVAAAVGAALLVVGAFDAGVLPGDEPPNLTRSALVGVWEDGSGGTLRLRADGTASASRVGDPGERCDGTGHWSLRQPLPDNGPTVAVTGDCGAQWDIGGSQYRPVLYYDRDDPDVGDRYELTRR
ncbi:hypothetical protein ACIRPT_11050 [Streptomyces sp. NPDC101227]|uniref:hypothetical protein n=1 Tax=Streptomyces sp. NPDC101227 TaxID=3366136 RepID=UPI00380ABCF0